MSDNTTIRVAEGLDASIPVQLRTADDQPHDLTGAVMALYVKRDTNTADADADLTLPDTALVRDTPTSGEFTANFTDVALTPGTYRYRVDVTKDGRTYQVLDGWLEVEDV